MFYALYLYSNHDQSIPNTAVNARARTARLFGRAQCTVSAFVTKWVKAFRIGTNSQRFDFNSALVSTNSGNKSAREKLIPENTQTYLPN